MKTFCPNCERETECTHAAELYECEECGEDFAKYIVSRNPSVSDVSAAQDVLTDIKIPSSIENTNPDYYKDEVHEFHFTEALRNLSKSRPADVSAIGVSILIDYVEELEQENKSIRHILSLWKKTEAMKEIERLRTYLKVIENEAPKRNVDWCRRIVREALGDE